MTSIIIRHRENGRSFSVAVEGTLSNDGIELSVSDIRAAMYLLEDAVQQSNIETSCPDAIQCERIQ